MVTLAPFLFTKCDLSLGIQSFREGSARSSVGATSNRAAVTVNWRAASSEARNDAAGGRIFTMVGFVRVEATGRVVEGEAIAKGYTM